jgi:predicted transcriptional regulator
MSATSQNDATIAVGELSIPVTVRELAIKDLRYYKSNPRIFRILKECGTRISQDVIERELWKLDSTKDLFRDIQNNGGLVEEILVRDSEVLEGNSRLCAYRRLLRKAKEKNDRDGIARWSRIRAKILPSDVSDEAVFAILGILHIRGKAKWLPYEQASYLRRQSVEYKKAYRELAEQIGVSEAEVRSHIEAYKMMDEYKINDPNKFSYFVEYVKSRKLKEAAQYLPAGEELKPLFVRWVENGEIPKGENVRDLPLVLKDKKARKKFLDKEVSFDDALEIAKDRHPETTSSFYSKLKRAIETLENAEEMRVKQDIESDTDKKYILKNLLRTVNKFCKAIGLEAQPEPRRRKKRSS